MVHKGWVYFEIRRGCYGLPQSGILETENSEREYKKRGIVRQELPQVYGDTNGYQYNFV